MMECQGSRRATTRSCSPQLATLRPVHFRARPGRVRGREATLPAFLGFSRLEERAWVISRLVEGGGFPHQVQACLGAVECNPDGQQTQSRHDGEEELLGRVE